MESQETITAFDCFLELFPELAELRENSFNRFESLRKLALAYGVIDETLSNAKFNATTKKREEK